MERATDRHGDLTSVDVVIVGGGLAGTSAAIVLGRQGLSVAVIDTHAVYPPEFRAEKLGDPHIALIDRLGLGETVRKVCTPVDAIEVHRFGRRIAREERREYGFAYADLVNALRGAIPPSVTFVVGRVAATAVGEHEQRITLADGRIYRGRLLIVATGLGDTMRRSLRIERIETKRTLSLSLGFYVAGSAADYSFQTLTAYGHRRDNRLAYLTLFPIGARMRANMFVYREAGEAWTKAFRTAPQAMLRDLLPELDDACRGFMVEGRIDVRPIDLIETRGYRQSGVALVGDAFQTTCPIAGHGILRVLTDVERLCTVHAPRWLETGGMGAEKIAAFYDDPVKTAADTKATRASLYARSMVVDDGSVWTARRLRNTVVRRGLFEAKRLFNRARPGAGGATMVAEPARSHL